MKVILTMVKKLGNGKLFFEKVLIQKQIIIDIQFLKTKIVAEDNILTIHTIFKVQLKFANGLN
ncbi:unnamed protein product [Paramecium pentaurelia]|uniref:Uncharacterized protein n=1 Tax=Paramecium pentaurelia TaxID=43138 RepID=A0A8S1X246_9CILI|nr:unnamed protein product [Paramecium pentaurelia]